MQYLVWEGGCRGGQEPDRRYSRYLAGVPPSLPAQLHQRTLGVVVSRDHLEGGVHLVPMFARCCAVPGSRIARCQVM